MPIQIQLLNLGSCPFHTRQRDPLRAHTFCNVKTIQPATPCPSHHRDFKSLYNASIGSVDPALQSQRPDRPTFPGSVLCDRTHLSPRSRKDWALASVRATSERPRPL